jgi:hypothetical protein
VSWTGIPPTVPGFYWLKFSDEAPHVFELQAGYELRLWGCGHVDYWRPEDLTGRVQFFGPIEPPPL